MRKLIMKMSMSVDGFVAGASGEIDWIFNTGDEESKAWAVENSKPSRGNRSQQLGAPDSCGA